MGPRKKGLKPPENYYFNNNKKTFAAHFQCPLFLFKCHQFQTYNSSLNKFPDFFSYGHFY